MHVCFYTSSTCPQICIQPATCWGDLPCFRHHRVEAFQRWATHLDAEVVEELVADLHHVADGSLRLRNVRIFVTWLGGGPQFLTCFLWDKITFHSEFWLLSTVGPWDLRNAVPCCFLGPSRRSLFISMLGSFCSIPLAIIFPGMLHLRLVKDSPRLDAWNCWIFWIFPLDFGDWLLVFPLGIIGDGKHRLLFLRSNQSKDWILISIGCVLVPVTLYVDIVHMNLWAATAAVSSRCSGKQEAAEMQTHLVSDVSAVFATEKNMPKVNKAQAKTQRVNCFCSSYQFLLFRVSIDTDHHFNIFNAHQTS